MKGKKTVKASDFTNKTDDFQDNSSKDNYENHAIIGQYTGKCADASVENLNHMTLDDAVWDTLFESDEYKTALQNKHYIGFLGHPDEEDCMDFRNACIILTECHKEKDGQIYGTFDLIDTPVGRIVKTYIDAGVNFGISVRGAGITDADGNVDPESFVFRGFDLVAFPAYPDAIPQFTEIAASSDLEKQVKYKAVCAAINTNISNINNLNTVKELQFPFSKKSNEYKTLEERKAEICLSTNSIDISKEKLNGVMSLYLQEVRANKKLKEQIDSLLLSHKKLNNQVKNTKRELNSIRRIAGEEITSAQNSILLLNSKNKQAVLANKQLKSKLNKSNLIYNKQINTYNKDISDKDEIIASLKSELSETVNSSENFKKAADNRDAKLSDAKSEISEVVSQLETYQEAYADLYASVLGIHKDAVPVSASTSVEDLKALIKQGSTSDSMSGSRQTLSVDIEDDDTELVTI